MAWSAWGNEQKCEGSREVIYKVSPVELSEEKLRRDVKSKENEGAGYAAINEQYNVDHRQSRRKIKTGYQIWKTRSWY